VGPEPRDRQRLGHEYLIVPSFTPDTTRSLDDWREWADRFNTAGAAARRAGIWLAFHNEAEHLQPIAGTVPYDLFVERTDPALVRHQLDVGNLVMGGGDPLLYLQRYRDRYWSFHLKDVVADRSSDTELGRERSISAVSWPPCRTSIASRATSSRRARGPARQRAAELRVSQEAGVLARPDVTAAAAWPGDLAGRSHRRT